jgi:uncharacterized protein
MMNNNLNDVKIAEILKKSRNIAVIGIKNGITDDAYKIPLYMFQHGYNIFPVNPKLAGEILFEHKTVSKITEFITPIDLVNIFRRPEYVFKHAEEILTVYPKPQFAWFQLGIYNDDAAELLEENGVKVIQNRCIMVEHVRLIA